MFKLEMFYGSGEKDCDGLVKQMILTKEQESDLEVYELQDRFIIDLFYETIEEYVTNNWRRNEAVREVYMARHKKKWLRERHVNYHSGYTMTDFVISESIYDILLVGWQKVRYLPHNNFKSLDRLRFCAQMTRAKY